MLACRGGKDQSQRVDAGGLLGAGLLEAGGEPFGQRVAGRGGARVDGPPAFAVLRCLDVQVPGDLDHLAVHRDHPGGRVDLGDGQGGQLTPPQPAVGCGGGHQLIAVAVPPGGQGLAEPGYIGVGGDLGGVDEQRRFPGHAYLRGGECAVPSLPVHLGQPLVDQVPALDPGAYQGRDHPLDAPAFPWGGRGVDDLLHAPGLDVLADDRVDDGGGEPLAQAALGMRVLAGPLIVGREPVR